MERGLLEVFLGRHCTHGFNVLTVAVASMMCLKVLVSLTQVTRERIRQIECKALRKLKHTGRLSAMEKYEAIERTPMAALMVMSE